MEQLNDSVRHSHEGDHDYNILFENGPVLDVPIYQARNFPANLHGMPSVLTEAQVLLGYQVDVNSSSIYNESDPISQMLRNLEKSVINEKDAEMSVLKSELEVKNKEIVEFEEKLTKLVDFITFVHGEFGKLLRGMMVMEIKDGSQVETNILRLGPFKNETVKNEFIQNLKDLSAQFLSDYENLTGTRKLLDKINTILSSQENVTNKQSAKNILYGNGNQVHSSVEQFNGGINYVLSFTQARTLPPPSNVTRPLPPSSCLIEMPPSVSSTHAASPPADITEYTDYPVLSIQEAPPPNFTAPMPQPSSSSNMTMDPTSSPSPLNLTLRRPPPSISRNSLQTDYGINLASANKKHGIDHSKGHWGFFCLCNTRFSSSGNLKDHIQYFTMKNFECAICKKRYHKSGLLKLHMISSHKLESLDEGMLTCSICHDNFKNWNEFREHLLTFHGIEKRRTSSKQSNFSNGSSKHARDVSTENPHSCICGKKYSHKNVLKLHINAELYGKVFKCCWCTRKFQTHAELKLHLSKVHGAEQDKQNKFGCTACGKTFPTLAEIRKHRSEAHRKVRENA